MPSPSRSPAITLAEAIQSLKDSITICVKHGYTEAICCGPEGAAPFRHSGEMLIDDALEVIALLTPSETKRFQIPIRIEVRPMLIRGQLAVDDNGPIILINSEEEPPHEQVVTLWHEVLHLIGMTDEFLCDEYAMILADICPDILRRIAHNINVPTSRERGQSK